MSSGEGADEVLGAGGVIASMRPTTTFVGCCKRRNTPRRSSVRRPAHSRGALQQAVEAQMARQGIFERDPAPELSFVQERVTPSLALAPVAWAAFVTQVTQVIQVTQVTPMPAAPLSL